jgi:hypothetical protein
MNKEYVVCTHNGLVLSYKENQIMTFAGKWLELEIII